MLFGFGYYRYLIFMLPALALGFYAQFLVKWRFKKFSQIAAKKGITGAEAAKTVLAAGGVHNVAIKSGSGELTDHYDPRDNSITLSRPVYSSTSIAAIGVAAHEAGHALQYAQGYSPIKLRAAVIPITRFGSFLGPLLIILGAGLTYSEGAIPALGNILYFSGIILFGTVALFQLLTLPVEFNASRRAMQSLESRNLLDRTELKGARKVLSAAALTYVAALITAVMQLLYYLSRAKRRR